MIHSLHPQQRDGLGLEGGSDIGREGKDKEGPLPISHSTPQAEAAQLVVAGLWEWSL